MRNFCGLIIAVLLTIVGGAGPARAQFKNGSQATELNLPGSANERRSRRRRSNRSITIIYHAPLAGGRELFGKTVPYGQGVARRSERKYNYFP